MEKLILYGGNRLTGEVSVSGAKKMQFYPYWQLLLLEVMRVQFSMFQILEM